MDCSTDFFICDGLNSTSVMLSMSVVFVVVIQWPTSTNMKPSCNAILYSYPFSMSCTCKSFEFAEISQKKFKTIQLKENNCCSVATCNFTIFAKMACDSTCWAFQ